MDSYQCNNNNNNMRSSSSSYICRQSSSRWIPTADQIRILRELYYNNGVRSPTAEQIQRISARLRQYGKIEGKNVFYWFQNHKARERQKKKLTMDNPTTNSTITYNINDGGSNIAHDNKLTSSSNILPCGLTAAGNGFGGSAVFVDRSIREHCSMGNEPTAMPWMYRYIKGEEESLTSAATREIETLPLFPTRSRDQEDDHEEEEEEEEEDQQQVELEKYYCNSNDYCTAAQPNGGYLPAAAAYYWAAAATQNQENYHHHCNASNGAASLELTLNSYYCAPPGSM